MKRRTTLFVFIFASLGVFSQNVQLHYDLGEDRKMFTSTVEMFKPDKLGNTFFFIDFNYGTETSGLDGTDLAYWEIARVIKTEKMPLGFHAEFNAGFGRFITGTGESAYRINEAWLGGVDYSWNNSDFTKGFSAKVMYKYIADKMNASFQLTGVWYLHFFDKKLSLTGFADFWREDSDFNYDGKADARYIFLTEPQFWYNATHNISVGTEIEMSNNFGGYDGFKVNPTLAAKWTF